MRVPLQLQLQPAASPRPVQVTPAPRHRVPLSLRVFPAEAPDTVDQRQAVRLCPVRLPDPQNVHV